MWYTSPTLLKIIVHVSELGITHRLYLPAGRARSFRCTSRVTATDVAWSAPGFQICPYGTSSPNNARPRATGRLYVTVTSVLAIRCETAAA